MLQQQLEQQQQQQQQQQQLLLQHSQARQREAGTLPAPVPGRPQPPLLTGSLGAKTLPTEIEEVEECASSGSFVGSSLSSTFLPTSASSNALCSMGQHSSIRVSRVGSESAPQVHGPEAQQQLQQQQQRQQQLDKDSAEAKDLCMRRSASGPALAALLQQQDQFRRGGAGAMPSVPSPAWLVPGQGNRNSDQEGDGDLGFHSPRGMSKGSLSDRFEGEKAWVGGKEADEARQQGKGSLTYTFLGSLLGGRPSAQQSTPAGTVHEGGSGVPLPHHHYRNPAHTSNQAALIIGSPTPPVSAAHLGL
ncbi:hypothetical protein DUNSADRAFT_1077 [Dunaliella salina]|uniref:Uncharacterized protein n=1 Tax=Dunaliella salina TaxID=3046 RepID=A0ABQ7FXZ8_DUNSA|nr:hypothetical protein DUNSADRAFT_1077 [Dunaliella salina]|eukprot:KAF5827240.1 hypothetical protein DUNSADRAFT_1077 [Dunaliella salina]